MATTHMRTNHVGLFISPLISSRSPLTLVLQVPSTTLFSCFIYTREKALRSKLRSPPYILLPVYLSVYGVPITMVSGPLDSPIRSNSLPRRGRKAPPLAWQKTAPRQHTKGALTLGDPPTYSLLFSESRRITLANQRVPSWS